MRAPPRIFIGRKPNKQPLKFPAFHGTAFDLAKLQTIRYIFKQRILDYEIARSDVNEGGTSSKRRRTTFRFYLRSTELLGLAEAKTYSHLYFTTLPLARQFSNTAV